MPAKFGLSTYGKTMLIEDVEELPPLRYVFILTNIILLAVMTIKQTSQYLRHRSIIHRKRGSSGLLTSMFISFTVNNILRGTHMIDHILRPVEYHEPDWAYNKILLSEMEVPTYSHFVIVAIGMIALGKMMTMLESGNRNGLASAFAWMIFWVPVSSFNLVHYTMEPPSNYGPFQNLNIAGSAITNIPILLLLICISYSYGRSGTGAASRADTDSKEQLISDDNRRVTRSRSARQRTPVKK